MNSIERRVKELVGNRRYDVIVAIITSEEKLPDKEKERHYCRMYEQEILTCKHPTLYHDTERGMEFVFAGRDDLENDEEYFEKFLMACKDAQYVEVFGIKVR